MVIAAVNGANGACDTGSDFSQASHLEDEQHTLHRALAKGELQGAELKTWLSQQMTEEADYNETFATPKKQQTTTTKRRTNKKKNKTTKTVIDLDLDTDELRETTEPYEEHTDSDYGDRESESSDRCPLATSSRTPKEDARQTRISKKDEHEKSSIPGKSSDHLVHAKQHNRYSKHFHSTGFQWVFA